MQSGTTQHDAEASLEEAEGEQRQVGVPPLGEGEQRHPHLSAFGR
jgi:hypothetical protein